MIFRALGSSYYLRFKIIETNIILWILYTINIFSNKALFFNILTEYMFTTEFKCYNSVIEKIY